MSARTKLELISFALCPYVQRAAIVLLEKGCAFDITYIDLKNKPDWFLEISPLGKVPVLKVDGEILFESAVIAEYLDETRPPRLHPADALQRARNRSWIEFSSEMLVSHFRLLMTKDEDEFCSRQKEMREKLTTLERSLGHGPFFNGERFSLVDAAFAPGFLRIAEAEKLHALGLLDGLKTVDLWSETLLQRPSVRQSVVSEFPDLFRDYLRQSGSYFATQMG